LKIASRVNPIIVEYDFLNGISMIHANTKKNSRISASGQEIEKSINHSNTAIIVFISAFIQKVYKPRTRITNV
jgi:hypothetical protein